MSSICRALRASPTATSCCATSPARTRRLIVGRLRELGSRATARSRSTRSTPHLGRRRARRARGRGAPLRRGRVGARRGGRRRVDRAVVELPRVHGDRDTARFDRDPARLAGAARRRDGRGARVRADRRDRGRARAAPRHAGTTLARGAARRLRGRGRRPRTPAPSCSTRSGSSATATRTRCGRSPASSRTPTRSPSSSPTSRARRGSCRSRRASRRRLIGVLISVTTIPAAANMAVGGGRGGLGRARQGGGPAGAEPGGPAARRRADADGPARRLLGAPAPASCRGGTGRRGRLAAWSSRRASAGRSRRSATRSARRANGAARRDRAGRPRRGAAAVAGATRASAERKQLAQLLGAVGHAPADRARRRRAARASARSRASGASRCCCRWCDSRLPQRRAAFQALRKAALLIYYMLPAPDGGAARSGTRSATRARSARAEDAPPKALDAARRRRATRRSTATSASSARARAAAPPPACSPRPGSTSSCSRAAATTTTPTSTAPSYEGSRRMYCTAARPRRTTRASACSPARASAAARPSTTRPRSARPTTCARSGPSHGVPAFAVGRVHGAASTRSASGSASTRSTTSRPRASRCCSDGLHRARLARRRDAAQRRRGCDQGESCGYCGFGCRLGAKQSTVEDVARRRAGRRRAHPRRRRARAGARRGRRRARRRGAHGRAGHRVTVRARAVVAACGALHTPALLRRSGLRTRTSAGTCGCIPATVVWGVFDEEVRPWEGTMQALYSDEHRYLDGGYGVKYETAADPPEPAGHLLAVARRARAPRADGGAVAHRSSLGVLLRDRDGGEVRVGRDGQPVVALPAVRLRRAPHAHRASRARRRSSRRPARSASSPRTRAGSPTSPARDGEPRAVHARRRRLRLGAGPLQLRLVPHHGLGAHGRLARDLGLRPDGADVGRARPLRAATARAFPTASGVNPMISIEAIAHMNARGLAARLR